MQPPATSARSVPNRAGYPRFRPPLLAAPAALGALLAVLLATESLLDAAGALTRGLALWGLLALLAVPLIGLLAWRGLQADGLAADAARHEQVRQLAQALACEPDPRRVPELLLSLLCGLTGARLAFLAHRADDGFSVGTVHGGQSARLLGQRLPISTEGRGIAAEAVRTGRPVILAETWNERGLLSRSELALSDRIRSAAVVPLLVRGETCGLIALLAEQPQQLHPAQEPLLAACSEQVGGWLEAARLQQLLDATAAAQQRGERQRALLGAAAGELRAALDELQPQVSHPADPRRDPVLAVGRQLAALAERLATMSTRDPEHQPNELDLAALLADLIGGWRAQQPDGQIVATVDGPLPVRADPAALEAALDGALEVVAEVAGAEGAIVILARAEPAGRATLRFSGQRRPAAERAGPEETASRPLARLAAVLSRLIVETHGGTLQLERADGRQSATVTISLPLVDQGTGRARAAVGYDTRSAG